MPGPGLYVAIVVVGVAAGIAFKEFVYDPHVSPKMEQWAGAYKAYRNERRRKRAAPHAYARVDSDSEGDAGSSEMKFTVGLNNLVEREMRNLGGKRETLRRRRQTSPDAESLELLENPNTSIPFVPLSPAASRNPFTSREDTALSPRLSTPASDSIHSESPSAMVPPPRILQENAEHQNRRQSPTSFDAVLPTPPMTSSPALSIPSQSLNSPATPVFLSPESRSRALSGSEYDLAHVELSRETTPFTSASVSRAGTPAAAAGSETSFSEIRDDSPFISDVERLSPHPDTDSFGGHSEISYGDHSELSQSDHSFDYHSYSEDSSSTSSISSDQESLSEGSEDLIDPAFILSIELEDRNSTGLDRPQSVLSDEEWERVSEANR